MASVTVYSPTERLAPVTTAKQQMVSGGFGEGIGESLQRAGGAVGQYAKAKDAYNARVEEAGVMELDTQFSERAREIERGFLAQSGRNAIDAQAETDEAYRQLEAEFLEMGSTTPRQALMMQAQLNRRRENWSGRRDGHVARETEVWQVGVEAASLTSAIREVIDTPPGTAERTTAFILVGARLDDIARRRGWSPEERAEKGFAAFSDIHLTTIDDMRNADNAAGALAYYDEFADQIDPTKRTDLRRATEEDYWTQDAVAAAEGDLTGGEDETYDVDPGDGSGPRQVRAVSPVSAAVGSRFGAVRPEGPHGGTDFPVPVNTPVLAMLPGIATVKRQPGRAGLYVEIDHGNGLVSQYMHLNAANVRDGQRVEAGSTIALSGGEAGTENAGSSTGPHLHVSVKRNGQNIDPEGVIGRDQGVGGSGGNAPSGPSFTTAQDVEDWARERSGGNARRFAINLAAGMAVLNRERSNRNDRESEGDRAANEWRAANPGALWSSAPTNIRNGASPSYRAREAEQEHRAAKAEEERGGADRLVGDTVYLDLLDLAASDPQEFLRRNPDDIRSMITPGQYATLRQKASSIRNGDNSSQNIDLIRPEMRAALSSAGFEVEPSKMGADDARAAADLSEYVETYAARHLASNGSPPSVADLRGIYRTGTALLRTSDGRQVMAASARNMGILPSSAPRAPARQGVAEAPRVEGFAIERRHLNWLRGRFRAEGVPNPTQRQIDNAYAAARRAGLLPE